MAERTSEAFDVRIAVPPAFETVRGRPHIELRRAIEARLAGTSDRALLATHLDRARADRGRAAPDEIADAPVPALHGRPHVVSDTGDVTAVELSGPPGGPPIFGATDVHVRTSAKGSAGVLRIPLDRERVARFVRGSVRLARWDGEEKRYRLLPGSSYRVDRGYAFGRITRSGTYTVLGLPSDERVLATIGVMSALVPSFGGELPGLLPKICELILCVDAGDAGPGGDICGQCLGGAGLGIDLDLFHLVGREPGIGVVPGGPIPVRQCEEWESVGPFDVPGRISALVIHPTDPMVLYAGSAAGGVFKTTDGGSSWQPLWGGELSLAIGGLAIAPSDPRVLYAGTGEWVGSGFTQNNHFPGVGVYRTSDGGAHWQLLTAISSSQISAVAIDPTDPDRVYVAGDRALHRTRNGGRTWDAPTGNAQGVFDGVVTDVVIDPTDPLRVYIAVDIDGIWRTTDGGNTWTKLTSGIGTGAAAVAPKIALGRNGAHGARFVAVLMATKVFTSIDGGNTFTQRGDVDPVPWAAFQAPWDTVIAVDPTDEQILLAGHVSLSRSTDGGATWTVVGGPTTPVTNVHVDQQAVVFDPLDHDRAFVATDGGVSVSGDNGRTWRTSSYGLVTTQCWTVAASEGAKAERIAITTQDNQCYQSMFGSVRFATILPWEGGIIEYDPTDADALYADTWFQLLKRSRDGGLTWTVIEPNALLDTESIAISRQDPTLLLAVKADYAFAPPRKRIHRSTDRGATWVQTLGGAINQLFATIAFAPSNDAHAYVGETNGTVSHSADRGQTWWTLPPGNTPVAPVSAIAVDPVDPTRVYVAFGALGVRHLWRADLSSVSAAAWTDVSGRIAAASLPDLAITGLALHPTLEGTIYAASVLGVYRSIDGGDSWAPYDGGLPHCFVSDLAVRPLSAGARLYASTMGRGVYARRV